MCSSHFNEGNEVYMHSGSFLAMTTVLHAFLPRRMTTVLDCTYICLWFQWDMRQYASTIMLNSCL